MMVGTIVAFLVGGLITIINFFLSLLPTFSLDLTSYLSDVSAYLGYLNWFVPVAALVHVTEVWLVAVAAYRAYLVFVGFFRAFKGGD